MRKNQLSVLLSLLVIFLSAPVCASTVSWFGGGCLFDRDNFNSYNDCRLKFEARQAYDALHTESFEKVNFTNGPSLNCERDELLCVAKILLTAEEMDDIQKEATKYSTVSKRAEVFGEGVSLGLSINEQSVAMGLGAIFNATGYSISDDGYLVVYFDKAKIVSTDKYIINFVEIAFRITQQLSLADSFKSDVKLYVSNRITLKIDTDGDGIWNGDDNCFMIANADQLDTDGDEDGDACDIDDDGDDAKDNVDNCPLAVNEDQADTDEDGIGDACEESAAAEDEPIIAAQDAAVDPEVVSASFAGACTLSSAAIPSSNGIAQAFILAFVAMGLAIGRVAGKK